MSVKDLFTENGSVEVEVDGGSPIHLTLDLLRQLIPPAFHDKAKQQPVRPPNNAEISMFAYSIIDDKLNPYKKELWCYWLKGQYTTVVSAFARMRKVQQQKDYKGWSWGWIGKDGTRHEQGGQIPMTDIVGAWADVLRKGRVPWHHELFSCDYQGKSWTMLQKTLRDQAHKIAYSDIMGNLSTENEAQFHDDFETTPDEQPEDQLGQEVIEVPDPTASGGQGLEDTGPAEQERPSWL